MDLKNLPDFLFADDRRGDGEMKFIIAEINGRFLVAAEINPTNHERIRWDLHKILSESGFHGEYKVHGGGRTIFFDEKMIRIYGVSADFGVFDADTAEIIFKKEFPDTEIAQ